MPWILACTTHLHWWFLDPGTPGRCGMSTFRFDVPTDSSERHFFNAFWDLAQPGSIICLGILGKSFFLFLTQEQVANSIELRRVSSTTGAERYLE